MGVRQWFEKFIREMPELEARHANEEAERKAKRLAKREQRAVRRRQRRESPPEREPRGVTIMGSRCGTLRNSHPYLPPGSRCPVCRDTTIL